MNGIILQRGIASLVVGTCIAMLFAPAGNAAETKQLYKCVNDKGVVSIQSSRCPAGSTEAWRRPAPTEPVPTAAEAAAAVAKIQRDQETVRELSAEVEKKLKAESTVITAAPAAARTPSSSLDPPTPEALAIEACQSAQAFASAVREKTWLGMTEDQTRRLYAWLADQCKVPTKSDD